MTRLHQLQTAVVQAIESLRHPDFLKDPEGFRYRIEQRLCAVIKETQPARPTLDDRFNLEAHEGLHDGEAVLILANGPSLRKAMTKLLLADVDLNAVRTIGMNRSWKAIEATYHVTLDAKNLEDPAVHWHPRLLFHYGDCARGFYMPYRDGVDLFPEDLPNGVPHETNSTTTLLALQLAVYLGFSPIFILGMDLNRDDHFDGSPTQISVKKQLRVLPKAAAILVERGVTVKLFATREDNEMLPYWPMATLEEITEAL